MQKKKPKSKNKTGRPRWVPTPDDIALIESLVAKGHTMENIGTIFNKNRDTLFERIKDTPEFSDAVKRGRADADNLVLSEFWQKLKAGETACILFYMKTRIPGWKEAQIIENVGKDGGAIQTEIKMTESETQKRIKEMLNG